MVYCNNRQYKFPDGKILDGMTVILGACSAGGCMAITVSVAWVQLASGGSLPQQQLCLESHYNKLDIRKLHTQANR
jgi:hypothetical protein